jgi:hypothetical protein
LTAKGGPKQLGQMLVERGLLTREQLDTALREHRTTPKSLGRSLIDLGYIHERDLVSVLAEQVGLEFVDLSRHEIDRTVATLLPDQLARHYRAIPIGEREGKLLVAMSDPANLYALDDIRTATDRDIQPVVGIASDIERVIEELGASGADSDAPWPATPEARQPGAGAADAATDEAAPVAVAAAGLSEPGGPADVSPEVNERTESGEVGHDVTGRVPVVPIQALPPYAAESRMGTSVPLEDLVAQLVTLTWVLVGATAALILATIVLIVAAITT